MTKTPTEGLEAFFAELRKEYGDPADPLNHPDVFVNAQPGLDGPVTYRQFARALEDYARLQAERDRAVEALAEIADLGPATCEITLATTMAQLAAEAISTLPPPVKEAEPEVLHPRTRELVDRFAAAVAEKLSQAERKYGYSDGWADPAWQEECRRQLHHHAAKGDPRDVAAYCAFCWHHGWPTTLPTTPPVKEAEPVAWRCGDEGPPPRVYATPPHAQAELDRLRDRVAALEGALTEAAKSMDLARRAIESGQVVDKDVHGTLCRARDRARAALTGEKEGEADGR